MLIVLYSGKNADVGTKSYLKAIQKRYKLTQ